MRIAVVAGARPQFVKAAALMPALRAVAEPLLVRTGQHADPEMVEAHFDGLGLAPPDVSLAVDPGLPRAVRLGRMVDGLARQFDAHAPDAVVVMGDTDSTVAGALAARFSTRLLAHVEAGARSGDRTMPEEVNRILVDELSDLLFCSTGDHALNLGDRDGVELTGDVMADVLAARLPAIRSAAPESDEPYAVLTLHRAATADDPAALARVLDAIGDAGLRVVFPVHPRTARALGPLPPSIEACAPMPWLAFLGLVSAAEIVLTDSGGLQKEACLLGVPCVTLRETTEWGETVESGWNVLAGTDPVRIRAALEEPPRGVVLDAPYGDGRAAERIAAALTSRAPA